TGLVMKTFFKIAAAGDAGSITSWSYTNAAASSGGITAISNVHTAAPFDATNNVATSSGTAINNSGVTTSGDNELIMCFYAIAGSNSTTFPGTLTSLYEVNPANTPDTSAGVTVQAMAGATGPFNATAANSGAHAAIVTSIIPGP